jgi:hypothetical protein
MRRVVESKVLGTLQCLGGCYYHRSRISWRYRDGRNGMGIFIVARHPAIMPGFLLVHLMVLPM